MTIDFEFPSSDVNASILTSTSNDDVINGLVMVLQLTPLHLSHSKSKDRNEEDGNIENKGTNKSSPVFSLKRTFFVLYRPGHNSPEFLLRRRQICQCLAKTWHIAPHTQAQELELHSKEIPSTHDLRRTVSCNRRFSCTYDNGDVYSGVVLRVTRDLQGIPLWSGKLFLFFIVPFSASSTTPLLFYSLLFSFTLLLHFLKQSASNILGSIYFNSTPFV